jgi:hypothetical protein
MVNVVLLHKTNRTLIRRRSAGSRYLGVEEILLKELGNLTP